MKRLIIGISGVSGVIYGIRLLEVLRGAADIQTHAVLFGAIVMPPVPAFYHRPSKLEEIIDQTINRALDVVGIQLDQDLFPRWHGAPANRRRAP